MSACRWMTTRVVHLVRLTFSSATDDDEGNRSGSVYVFERDGSGTWVEIAKLLGQEGDGFGFSIALNGNSALVGTAARLAFLVERDELGKWSKTEKLLPYDGPISGFGDSVALSGSTALVGARGDDENGESSGSAYIFDLEEGSNTSPECMSARFRVKGNGVLHGQVVARDDDGGTLTFSLISDSVRGMLEFKSNGSFIFHPDSEFVGVDAFTYIVVDR